MIVKLIYSERTTNLKKSPNCFDVTKGQQISKQNCRAADSPKKRTNEFVFWESLRLNNFVSRSTDL